MHTPDAVADDVPVQTEPAPAAPLPRIDVALVDRLLAVVSRCEAVTRRDVVRLTAAIADVPYYGAEGFVTDVVQWSTHRGDEAMPAGILVDALLDLRHSLAPAPESVSRTRQ